MSVAQTCVCGFSTQLCKRFSSHIKTGPMLVNKLLMNVWNVGHPRIRSHWSY